MFVDLHVHLRGTISPAVASALSIRNGIPLGTGSDVGSAFAWNDFPTFLRTYDNVSRVIATARDLEEVTYAYLHSMAADGGMYAELMISPPDLARVGVPIGDQVKAVKAGAVRAREESGIEGRMIATAVRHLGPEAALEAARAAASEAGDMLVGFGLTGDEQRHETSEFVEAFRIARSSGLRTTAHAGEHMPAETILDAVELLRLDRIGHGVRAAECEIVLRQLAAAEIPLEVCLTSNIRLGLYPSLDCHPIAALASAGCSITLGTDDPGFFDTSIRTEYGLASEALGYPGEYGSISRTAVEAAFCDDQTKASLRARIDLTEKQSSG